MTVFALDSASKAAGVCILQDGRMVYHASLCRGLTHSETLLPLCDEAFRAAQITPADVDVFAAAAGPGSFTGLRIGLATLKGLAFVHNTPCVCVSTLEALALSQPCDGIVAAALDARRGEVYCAAFRVRNGAAERLFDDGAMPAAEFAARLDELDEPGVCAGDGAQLVCAHTERFRALPEAYRTDCALGAALAAHREALAGRCVTSADCIPDYQRLSQAQRERAAREAVQKKES